MITGLNFRVLSIKTKLKTLWIKRHACGFQDQKLIRLHMGIKILIISIVKLLNEVERISLP